ncbi:hypothetical protein D9M69_517110 [compost metagenome]
MAHGEFLAHVVDDGREALPVVREPALDRAAFHAHVRRHLRDAATPAGQEQQHRAPHVARQRVAGRRRRSVEQLPCIARHGRVGRRVGRVQVVARADDAVEVLVEGDGRAQHAVVRAQVARRGVRQAHAPGLPVGAEKLPQQAQHHAQRQFDALARGAVRLAGLHFLADDHHLAEGLDHQRQRAVEQRLVAHQHVERIAQRRLLAHQQADGPEVRQPPPLGHAQPEALVA